MLDQVECHDQTSLHRVPHNDESLSVRVDVVLRVEHEQQVVGKLKQHVASPDRYVVTCRQLISDQLPLGIPVEELLPIGSPDGVSPASMEISLLFPGSGKL